MTKRKWKPGDKITVLRKGAITEQVTALRIVALAGVREFALHESAGTDTYTVTHIPTGLMVAYGNTKAGAVIRAARCVSKQGGAPAIRAAVERHKEVL